VVEASLGKQFVKPYFENTQHKKGLVQVVEHLSSKHKVLSSSPSTATQKKKKKKK
jgi:hypothetical protein